MSELQIFNNAEFGKIRTVTKEDKTYFVGNDVAKALGYAETAKAIRTHCKGVSEMDIPTNGGIQKVKVIPEGDIYRLIIKSQLPSASKFESWIFDEVIPAIRKTGAYCIPTSTSGQIQLLAQGYTELEQKVILASERVDTVEKRMKVLEDTSVVDSRQRRKLKLAGVSAVLKALGGKSSNAYNDDAIRAGVFTKMWHDYKEHFELTSYHDTPKAKLNEAFDYLEMWEPPTNLKINIKICNEEVA